MALIKPIGDMNEVDALRAIVAAHYVTGATGGAGGSSPATTILETGTTPLTGLFTCISIVTATVFATLTGMGGDTVAGVTFPAGMNLYGRFTAVTLTSGSVVLYA